MPCQFVASSVSMRSAVVMMLWIIIGSINLSLGQGNARGPGPPNQPPPNSPPPSGPPPPQNPPPLPDPQNSSSSFTGPSSTKQMSNQQSTTTEIPDPLCGSDACPIKRGNYNFPMANNCSWYYSCRGNSDPRNQSCGTDELFDKNSAQCVATSDQSICLHCPTTGTSPAYTSVSSSSAVISSSTSTRSPLPSSSSSLVTSRASTGPTSSGNLTCCAITSGFLNSTSISYQVFVKPRVAIDPEFVSARPEDPVLLNCTAVDVSDIDDFPISVYRIIWLKNDRTILFTDELVNSSFPVVSVFNGTFLQSTNVTCVLELSLVNVTSNIAFVHITADDNGPGCKPQTTSGVDWFFTKVGDSNFRPCPGDKAGSAVRLCAAADMWDQPDLSNCISKSLIDLKQQIDVVQSRTTALDNQTMTNLSVIIYNTVINQVNMTEAEFQLIVEIIADMADIHANSPTNTFLDKTELLTMMGTVSVLLGIPDSGKMSKSSAVLLLSSVDIYTSLYAKQIDSDSVFSIYPNMVVETGGFLSLKSTSLDENERQIPSWNKIDEKQPDAFFWANAKDNGIRVNPTTSHNSLGASASSNYTSSCIRNLGNMMPLTEDQIRNHSYINSYLVSLTIIGLNSGSIPPVVITLDHLKINTSMFGKCVYWNFSSSANGSWMDNGCTTVLTNDSHTVCNCSHLTNFAILMSSHPATGVDDIVLSTISMVGCLVSVVALVLTILLYVSQWKKMKSKRAVVLLNLCISLIIANIIFLAGSNQTKSEIGCKVVAALLHYFFLAAFFIMLLEGILLLMYVICVFYVHRKSHTIVLLVSAWIIPAIIVAVSLGVTKTDGYGTEKTCWLSVEKNVIWAFVGPALFVILVNLIIIIIVLIKIGSAKVRSDLKKKRNKIVSVLRNVVILSPILGVTWIFGVLSVNHNTRVFQYIFCIANTLQGLYIFILHGLCHAKNKKSSVSSKPKRWTVAPSRISAQQAHIPLSEGDSQEDLVRSNKAEKELYLEQNVVKENSMYKVPYAHQLSNMSHISNGTASTCVSNSLSANGMASPH